MKIVDLGDRILVADCDPRAGVALEAVEGVEQLVDGYVLPRTREALLASLTLKVKPPFLVASSLEDLVFNEITTPERTRLPKDLPALRVHVTAAWRHQLEGVYLALKRAGFLFAFDMGTGKTKAVIDTVQNAGCRLVVVIAPKAVVENWPTELRLHAVASYQHHFAVDTQKSVAQRAAALGAALRGRDITQPFVAVVDHASVTREPMASLLLSFAWDCIVVDEAHKICDPTTKFAQAIYYLSDRNPGAKRLAMTGTQFGQYPLKIFGIARFVDPTVFGKNQWQFEQQHGVFDLIDVPTKNGPRTIRKFARLADPRDFAERCAVFMLRADKSQVPDMPDATHIMRRFDLPAAVRRQYNALKKEWRAEIGGVEVMPDSGATKLLRLMQMTSGIMRSGDNEAGFESGKRELFAELLDSDELHDEPLVVFALFTHDLAEIKRTVESAGRRYFELSGKRNQWQEWQNATQRGDVIGVQIQAGGVGINLTRASYVVYYSKGHSLTDFDQSLARCRRSGQKRHVTYIHLLARDSADEDVTNALTAGMELTAYLNQQIDDITHAA